MGVSSLRRAWRLLKCGSEYYRPHIIKRVTNWIDDRANVMKFEIQYGEHQNGKWVVISSEEFSTLAEARNSLIETGKHLDSVTLLTHPFQNYKLYDTGEDNLNKNPKLYHYICTGHTKMWMPGDI